MAAQAGLRSRRRDRQGGFQRAVLIPALEAVIVDHHLLFVHVIGDRVADEAVDCTLFFVSSGVGGHHLAQRRLVLAADMALTATFGHSIAVISDNDFGPRGHRERTGLGAGAVNLAHREIIGQHTVEAVHIRMLGSEKQVVGRAGEILHQVFGSGETVVAVCKMYFFMAAETGSRTFVCVNTGLLKAFNMNQLVGSVIGFEVGDNQRHLLGGRLFNRKFNGIRSAVGRHHQVYHRGPVIPGQTGYNNQGYNYLCEYLVTAHGMLPQTIIR